MVSIVSLLTIKSVKTLLRQQSVAWLIVMSALVVYGCLLTVFWLSDGQTLSFMTSVSGWLVLLIQLDCMCIYHILQSIYLLITHSVSSYYRTLIQRSSLIYYVMQIKGHRMITTITTTTIFSQTLQKLTSPITVILWRNHPLCVPT